jgi:hypothetical protein
LISVQTLHLLIEPALCEARKRETEREEEEGRTDPWMAVERAHWKLSESDLMNFSTSGLTSRREAEETMSATWNCE